MTQLIFSIYFHNPKTSRSQTPRGLRRRSAAARLLRSWVRIPPGARMFVCCECCCVFRERFLRRADHSSRGIPPTVMRRCVWSRNLKNEEAMAMGCSATGGKKFRRLGVSLINHAHHSWYYYLQFLQIYVMLQHNPNVLTYLQLRHLWN